MASSSPGLSVNLRLAAWGPLLSVLMPSGSASAGPVPAKSPGSLGAWLTSTETPSGDPLRRDQDVGSLSPAIAAGPEAGKRSRLGDPIHALCCCGHLWVGTSGTNTP